MKFKFVGDSTGHGPDELAYFGSTFKKNGDYVEVNEEFGHRFTGNSHFIIEQEPKKVEKKKKLTFGGNK